MRIHPIQTGRVQIKQAQIEGRGHGTWRQLQPIFSRQWAAWSPTYAWAIEHPDGVIVVDTAAPFAIYIAARRRSQQFGNASCP